TGDKGDTGAAGADGADGADGAPGDDGGPGADGADGCAITIRYTFDRTTADADPGSGKLRLDNATQDTATTIRTDLLDVNATDWTAVLDSLDDSTNTLKGHIRLVKTDDFSKWLVFSVTAVATPSGYRNISVTP